MATQLKAGDPAPDFTLPSHVGDVSLHNYRGKTVILAFYPLDFSPVCSVQIPEYQKNYGEFEKRGIALIGISRDSTYCHKAWSEELGGVDFPLLADLTGEVAKLYGVWIPEKGVAARAIFAIDRSGVIRRVHEEKDQNDRRTSQDLLDMVANLSL